MAEIAGLDVVYITDTVGQKQNTALKPGASCQLKRAISAKCPFPYLLGLLVVSV